MLGNVLAFDQPQKQWAKSSQINALAHALADQFPVLLDDCKAKKRNIPQKSYSNLRNSASQYYENFADFDSGIHRLTSLLDFATRLIDAQVSKNISDPEQRTVPQGITRLNQILARASVLDEEIAYKLNKTFVKVAAPPTEKFLFFDPVAEYNFNYFSEIAKDNRIAGKLRQACLEPTQAKRHLRYALTEIEALFIGALNKYDVNSYDEIDTLNSQCANLIYVIDHMVKPYLCFLLNLAIKFEDRALFEQGLTFLTQTIPQETPGNTPYEGNIASRMTLGSNLNTISQSRQLEWGFRIALDREQAKKENSMIGWFSRLRTEMGRGGVSVDIDLLTHFAQVFDAEESPVEVERTCRLMMQKSLMQPTPGNIETTLRTIQGSSLSNDKKDELLAEFLEKIFSLIKLSGGADLTLLAQIRGLFPWQTPFMDANDLPHYKQTEALLVRELAAIPELVQNDYKIDDRLRLAAFAGAGLPLQRYHHWIQAQATSSDTLTELDDLALNPLLRQTCQELGLPHPFEIPPKLSEKNALHFLSQHEQTIDTALHSHNAHQRLAAIRVLHRVLGSELRERTKRGFPISSAVNASFILQRLEPASAETTRAAFFNGLFKTLFKAGPPTLHRTNWALTILGWPLTQDEKRAVFGVATDHLVFGTRVKTKISQLKQRKNHTAENEYYEMLLGIDYSRHPNQTPSEFFLLQYESRADLRNSYKEYLEKGHTSNLVILSECQPPRKRREQARATYRHGTVKHSPTEQLKAYTRTLRFLKEYLQHADFWELGLDYFDRFYFRTATVEAHWFELNSYFSSSSDRTNEGISTSMFHNNPLLFDIDGTIDEFDKFLATRGFQDDLYERLSPLFDSREDTEDDIDVVSYQRTSEEINALLDAEITRAERILPDIFAAELNAKATNLKVPDFIKSRRKLSRNLLLWTYTDLQPEQRTLLDNRLKTATTDRERLRHLGVAAHFEKLMQLASIHPSVPSEMQDMFAIFQEHVPHRDKIDVHRTVRASFPEAFEKGSFRNFHLGAPIKEGTIGGVYEARYQRQDIALKVIPYSKYEDIQDSLRIVKYLRRCLWATNFIQPGARTVDDLLAFYERTILEETDLTLEPSKARSLQAVVPKGFIVPEYIDDLADPFMVGMERVDSRRLAELLPHDRQSIIRRIDNQLIPAMLKAGVFHYDLHPGNLGVLDDGRVVLYDVGRVQTLTQREKNYLVEFYKTVMLPILIMSTARKTQTLRNLFRNMGRVRDEAAYTTGIDAVIEDLLAQSDPIAALEQAYPRLADCGLCLDDNYVKLLFMFLTWNGTKKTFGV